MTKTVKKRLQAVVALLVTLMIMVGIMPSEALEGILKGATVNAAGYQFGEGTTIYFNASECNANEGNWTSATSIEISLYYSGNDHWYSMTKDSSITTQNVFKYTFDSTTGNCSVEKLKFHCIAGGSNKLWSYYTGEGGSCAMTEGAETYSCKHNNGNDMKINIADTTYHSTPAPATSDKSILVGVKYYNYFYDEQIAYEMADGTDDPTSLTVTNGQAKNPYTLFNRAIMASDYGGNNTLGNHGNDGSGGNKTSYPVMYLGEFWLGGGAENNGSGYMSSPNDVSAGKYPRSVNINDGGSTITLTQHNLGSSDVKSVGGSNQQIQNDTLTNFTWGANLASRGSGGVEMYYHMLAQGLVDETLSMDPTSPNYLVPTINGQRIPYFDEKFLYYANPNNSSEIWNADLADITSRKDVGHVYTSIFPFYRKDVTFESDDAFSTSSWKDSWINRSGTSWGRSLTTDNGKVTTASEYYTFNSKTDTVSINTAGGATSDPGNATGGYGDTYWALSLDGAVADATAGQVFTQDYLDDLVEEYSVANYNTNRPIIEGVTDDATSNNVEKVARAINLYKNGTMFTDAEVALLTIAGYFDNSGSDAGHVKDVDMQYGYFPFNTSSDGLSNLQYGFGTRLDIRFNILKDGKTTEGAPEIFRFTGDDDVWVFIDGQLVLDMGGGHKNGIGEINFENGKAAVLYAGSGSSESAWQTSTQGRGGSNGVKTTTPTILSSIKAEATNSATGISEDHTLTMFYMERGKLNSNMSVMFNFKAPDIIDITPTPGNPNPDFPHTPDKIPAPNPVTTSKLKIREISNFENVNPGLIGLTKKAAEDDVFKYTIQSNTVRNSSMGTSGIWSPSRDTYTRTNQNLTTVVSSGLDNSAGMSNLADAGRLVYLVIDKDSSYYTDVFTYGNAGNFRLWIGSSVFNSPYNSTGYYVEGRLLQTGTAGSQDLIYAFELPVGLKSSGTGYDNYYFGYFYDMNPPDEGWAAQQTHGDHVQWTTAPSVSGNKALYPGKVYKLKDWQAGDTGRLLYAGVSDFPADISQGLRYSANNFSNTDNQTLSGVGNVNYIWKEAFTTKTGSADSQLVNTTTSSATSSGTFNLLYGTSDDESSALFKNQFYDPVAAANATPSYTQFNVSQSMVKRNNTGTVVNNWTLPTGGRVMGKYYSTRISTVKRNVVVNNVAQTQTAELAITDGSYKADRKETELTNNIVVNSPDMDIIISNYINVANVSVGKTVQYKTQGAIDESKTPKVYSDEYYFAVRITDVFGQVGNDVTDYRSVKYIKNNNTAEQFNMENVTVGTATLGKITIAAGEVATIIGIPEGTICDIVELHESKNFNSTAWASEYNVGVNGNSPTLTSTLYTGSDTNGTSLVLSNTLNTNADDGNTTYTGLTNAWRITGAHDNPGYMRALLVFGNIAEDPPVNFSVKPIVLIVEKVWDTTDTLEETPVKFVVEYQSVADGSSLSSDEDDWKEYNYDNNHSDGIVTLSSSDLVSGVSPITWRKTLTSSAPDKADKTHTYYYRIREWGKNDAVFIYKDGGFYSENFKAVYGAGTQDSPVTNIGSGDTTASASNSYKTVVPSESNGATTYTLTLQIKNEYRSTSIDPKPLPKTGAAGVYAIVTFGAFAITIAGVALLIYRKKLQTVNIYAVKGSEKAKE